MRDIMKDGTPEARWADILYIMENHTFGKREASKIVGGRGRLKRLIDLGKIRENKVNPAKNGKCFCNGADVLKYAIVVYKNPRNKKRHEKTNRKCTSAKPISSTVSVNA